MKAEEFEKKLTDFLAMVPDPGALTSANPSIHVEYYGEVLSGKPVISMPGGDDPASVRARDKGKKQYEQAKRDKSFTTTPDFTRLTGMTHEGLMDDWYKGTMTTSCNGFVGRAALAVGFPGLGGFDLEKTLSSWGKHHCWVKPDLGETPQFGDIYESSKQGPGYLLRHVGVSVSVENSIWHTVEGGQGGPLAGVDKVARIKKPYNTTHVRGWIDMRRLVSGTGPVPDWLLGDWMIFSGAQNYVYSFDYRANVIQKLAASSPGQIGPAPRIDSGQLLNITGDQFKLEWDRVGGTEMFVYDRWNSSPGLNDRMTGVADDGSKLTGVRL